MGSCKTYAEQKRRDLYRHRGVSLMVDAGPMQRRIRLWVDSGILCKDIAARAGVSKSFVQQHYNGISSEGEPMHHARSQAHDKVMAARFSRSEIKRYPVVGIRRRLRALMALGYTTVHLERLLGRDNQQVSNWTLGRDAKKFFSVDNALNVIEVYEKYSTTDPLTELGEPAFGVRYAQNRARKLGYAPPGCWDADTIDDPDAFPEWTGACGSMTGWRIHAREGIHPCAACHEARREDRKATVKDRAADAQGPTFDLDAFRRARERAGYSKAGLAVAAGLDPATVQGWEAETRRPTIRTLEMVARVLDATLDDFHHE